MKNLKTIFCILSSVSCFAGSTHLYPRSSAYLNLSTRQEQIESNDDTLAMFKEKAPYPAAGYRPNKPFQLPNEIQLNAEVTVQPDDRDFVTEREVNQNGDPDVRYGTQSPTGNELSLSNKIEPPIYDAIGDFKENNWSPNRDEKLISLDISYLPVEKGDASVGQSESRNKNGKFEHPQDSYLLLKSDKASLESGDEQGKGASGKQFRSRNKKGEFLPLKDSYLPSNSGNAPVDIGHKLVVNDETSEEQFRSRNKNGKFLPPKESYLPSNSGNTSLDIADKLVNNDEVSEEQFRSRNKNGNLLPPKDSYLPSNSGNTSIDIGDKLVDNDDASGDKFRSRNKNGKLLPPKDSNSPSHSGNVSVVIENEHSQHIPAKSYGIPNNFQEAYLSDNHPKDIDVTRGNLLEILNTLRSGRLIFIPDSSSNLKRITENVFLAEISKETF